MDYTVETSVPILLLLLVLLSLFSWMGLSDYHRGIETIARLYDEVAHKGV